MGKDFFFFLPKAEQQLGHPWVCQRETKVKVQQAHQLPSPREETLGVHIRNAQSHPLPARLQEYWRMETEGKQTFGIPNLLKWKNSLLRGDQVGDISK